jgi:hypothetical protein
MHAGRRGGSSAFSRLRSRAHLGVGCDRRGRLTSRHTQRGLQAILRGDASSIGVVSAPADEDSHGEFYGLLQVI